MTADVMRSATFLRMDGRMFDISREDWDQFIADALDARKKLQERDAE
jgi:hypothetical protein